MTLAARFTASRALCECTGPAGPLTVGSGGLVPNVGGAEEGAFQPTLGDPLRDQDIEPRLLIIGATNNQAVKHTGQLLPELLAPGGPAVRALVGLSV